MYNDHTTKAQRTRKHKRNSIFDGGFSDTTMTILALLAIILLFGAMNSDANYLLNN